MKLKAAYSDLSNTHATESDDRILIVAEKQ
jgi:hypothetical protein